MGMNKLSSSLNYVWIIYRSKLELGVELCVDDS